MAEIKLNINWDDLHKQIGKLVSSGAGMATGAAGAAGGGGGANVASRLGAGLLGPAGSRTETIGKGLGQISKQLPGVGMFGDMAKAFTTGGLIGVGMAGIAGILSFVKQIMESSKVFQGIAGSFFKIFGAMADLFLLPFLPVAMRGMQALLKYLPNFGEWGQKASGAIEKLIGIFEDKGFFGGIKQIVKNAWGFIKGKALPFLTEKVVPLLDEAATDISNIVMKRMLGNIVDPIVEGAKEAASRDKESYSSIFSENPFGAGAIMDTDVLHPWTGDYKRQKDIEERLGPQWRDKLKEEQIAGGANQSMGEMQLGGSVSGINQGGSGGRSVGSGFNPELGNPLRNIRGKAMDVITGVGEDVRQLRKDTATYVDKSSLDFRNLGMDFSGGLRDSMNIATSNVAVLEDTVQKVVTQAKKDITYLENQVKSTQIVVSNAIQAFSINLASEIADLEDEANAQRNSILDTAIYFKDVVTTWVGSNEDIEGLSSSELRELSGKLAERTVIQEGVEEDERIEAKRIKDKAIADKKIADKKIADKIIADKIIADKKIADKIIADKIIADDLAAAKAEEFRINTLTASPMFKSFEKMQNKLESLQNRLVSQESQRTSLYANVRAIKGRMEEVVGPLGDSRSAVGLQKRRRQQYWTGVVRPAQIAAQQMSETISQTRQDISNVEHWIATKHIPAVWSNYRGRVYENTGIAEHQRSNLNFDAGGIVPGDIGEPQLIWAQGGEQISPIGMPKNNGGGNTSNRVLNISIETKSSVKDILIDLANLKALDDASLFNSVW